ncbi:MAG: ATP-dependent DNA helicase [Lachnospiraceae bacterium]|nr:ATP-dependent DNA helicase [Lachnospiraceae bacterium]
MTERISVRAFVEFLLREGDIDNRLRASSEKAMREGVRIHKKIQKMRGPLYRAEVPLSYTYDTGRYELRIEGRADGVMDHGAFEAASARDDAQMTLFDKEPDKEDAQDIPLIEEIKGTYRNVTKMEAPVPVHLAQALCYAHFYCIQENVPRIRVVLTYVNLDTEEKKEFPSLRTARELADCVEELIRRYIVWSDFRFDHREERNASIRKLTFPYAYRRGQKDLAEGVYRTIVHERKLFLEAPTGSGKTLATLFPAIKAIGEEKAERIFYMTARTIARRAPQEAVRLMRAHGALKVLTVTLTAKEKICTNEVCDCNPDSCPFAKGHFDRVNDALLDILSKEEACDRETITAYAKKHAVCPFEYALDLSGFADIVICDYNYLFDPFVYLRRFFAEGEERDHLFLVDEAHNLIDRGREMYSASLSVSEMASYLSVCTRVKRLDPVREKLEQVVRELERLAGLHGAWEEDAPGKRNADDYCVIDDIERLTEALRRLNRVLSDYLDSRAKTLPRREEMLALYFALYRFRTIADETDHRYVIYGDYERPRGKAASFVLHLFCVDPSARLAGCMAKGVASVLFSATMLPVQYYKHLLGGAPSDYEIYAQTSFLPENCAQVIVNDVTSRYTARTSGTYQKIARAVHEVTGARKGNYLVFFPSFAFLGEVLAHFEALFPEEAASLRIQRPEMGEEEREVFLDSFTEEGAVCGFCVLGGIFAEGIDLTGRRLIGAVIVGTGLPLLSAARGVIRGYFDGADENGFDYAYRFPGMNRVLQAAGRVIRTSDDTGVIALLDDRFAWSGYRSLFPREWGQVSVLGTDKVRQHLTDFWTGTKESH